MRTKTDEELAANNLTRDEFRHFMGGTFDSFNNFIAHEQARLTIKLKSKGATALQASLDNPLCKKSRDLVKRLQSLSDKDVEQAARFKVLKRRPNLWSHASYETYCKAVEELKTKNPNETNLLLNNDEGFVDLTVLPPQNLWMKFAQLQKLNLTFSSISDIRELAGLGKLQVLYLHNTSILEAREWTGLENLETLTLHSTSLSIIEGLAGLRNLKTLHLIYTFVSDIAALGRLEKLEILSLTNTPVFDITALAGLENLRELYLARTLVSDITALARLKKVEMLILSDAPVSDIKALVGLENLKELYLLRTLVRDITALAGLKNLRMLSLKGVPHILDPLPGEDPDTARVRIKKNLETIDVLRRQRCNVTY